MNAYELAQELHEDLQWIVTLNTDLKGRLALAINMLRQQADRIAELEFENKAFRKELFNIGSIRSCSYAAQHHGFVSPRQAGDDAREYIAEILEKAKTGEQK